MNEMNVTRFLLPAVIFLALLSACVTGPPQLISNDEANRAFEKGEYSKARDGYERALGFAEQNGDRQYSAIAMYGLARVNIQLCEPTAAENWLLKSIELRESIPNSPEAYITQNRMELARLYFRHKRFQEANTQFTLAVQGLESLKIERTDPIAYANELDDYARSLRGVGRYGDADAILARAERLRAENPDMKPHFRRDPEPNCIAK
jgi:tetratricopeptide (TPR) repeat protein